MNHRRAAQLSTGGWHMVSGNRRVGTYPVGNCAEHLGHETEVEARECFAQYQRDRVQLDGGTTGWTDCTAKVDDVRCPNPTKQFARIEGDGYKMAPLCPEHMTIEHAIKALGLEGPAGDAWYS